MGLVYAIDFGTSNSLLAAAEPGGKIHPPIALDPHAPDPSVLRSILYFPTMHQVFYGAEAIRKFIDNDGKGRLIRSIKKQLPARSFIGTWIDDRPVNLEDLIGYFLKEVRKRANAHFGEDVESVVLGRPARFSDVDIDDSFAQYRLEQAARIAGFKHIAFCPEPVAAAHEFRLGMTEPKLVLVADFGGGTSDYTIVRLSRDAFRDADVLAIGGVALAGDALDGSVMRQRISRHFGASVEYRVPFGSNVLRMPAHLIDKICSPSDISLLTKRDAIEFLQRVRQWALGPDDRRRMDALFCLIEDQLGFSVFEAIEGAKRALSTAGAAPFVFEHGLVDIREILARKDFEDAIHAPLTRICDALDDTVKRAGIRFEDVDIVCCTGGTAKVPAIQRELVKRFGAAKVLEHNHFHSVVRGLAERARAL